MENEELYHAVKGELRPGDIIAFQGQALISNLIHLFTASPVSHVGVVRWAEHPLDTGGVRVTNSTIEGVVSGPQTVELETFLKTQYLKGRAWWLRLSPEIRKLIDWEKFYAFIGGCEGFVKYDIEGLVGFVARQLPVLGSYLCQTNDPHQMFCDAYCIAIFESCGILRGINPRKMTPQDLVEMKIYQLYQQIWGSTKELKNFNTV